MRPPSKRDGPPDWFDHTETELGCDHDSGSIRVKYEYPYARFECNDPDCNEGKCRVMDTDDGN